MELSEHVAELAAKAAGNWLKFESFAWDGSQRSDFNNWHIANTTNRDADIVTQSNHAALEKALAGFTSGDDPDVINHRASHWACGWVEGFEIRVYRANGEVTEAFKAYAEFAAGLEDYAIADECDVGAREYAAALENIADVGRSMVSARAPKSWADRVHCWLGSNAQSELENTDGRGAYPSAESVRAALVALRMADRETWLAHLRGETAR